MWTDFFMSLYRFKHQFSKTQTYTMLERVHTKLLSTKLFSFYYVQEFINHFGSTGNWNGIIPGDSFHIIVFLLL